MSKIKIVVSTLFFPMTMARYFIRALERRSDIELITAGPSYGTWIPWNQGMILAEKYAHIPNIPLPTATPPKIDPMIVENRLPWKPDLWLQIDSMFHFSKRPKGEIVATVGTDPHALYEWYEEVREYSDYFFNMQSPYLKGKDIYLPYAYDPTIHYPMDIPKDYDVCLIGIHYDHRNAVMRRLQQNGLKIYYGIGKILDEYREINNQARIGFNWSSLDDLNARFWELSAMAIPMVANPVPDADTFFVKEEHYFPFKDEGEAVGQVIHALHNYDHAKEVGQNAYRKVTSGKNTWDDRVQRILEACKLI
jgi:hypothetical protein